MLKKIVVWVLTNALALGVAAWLVPGIEFTGSTKTSDRIVQVICVGAVFGIVNAFVKPAAQLLSFPFIILSLGLLLIVINALMLLLTSKIAGDLSLNFHVDTFGDAILGAVVIMVAGLIIESVLPDPNDR
ncbi:MAG: phage holin family protein [Marmoricola sp.]